MSSIKDRLFQWQVQTLQLKVQNKCGTFAKLLYWCAWVQPLCMCQELGAEELREEMNGTQLSAFYENMQSNTMSPSMCKSLQLLHQCLQSTVCWVALYCCPVALINVRCHRKCISFNCQQFAWFDWCSLGLFLHHISHLCSMLPADTTSKEHEAQDG